MTTFNIICTIMLIISILSIFMPPLIFKDYKKYKILNNILIIQFVAGLFGMVKIVSDFYIHVFTPATARIDYFTFVVCILLSCTSAYVLKLRNDIKTNKMGTKC